MYLLFDIGGTKMRVAVSRDGLRQSADFGAPRVVPTPTLSSEIAETLSDLADELSGGATLKAVAGGMTRKRQGAAAAIKKLFDCPVYLENDAALAGLGEVAVGAGKGAKIAVYLTISTGVGGARIVDGRLDEKLRGFEPGHQIIDWQEPARHWEDYISGTAVKKQMGREPKLITDDQFWRELAKPAAVGLHNVIMHWSPEVIILGGGMMGDPGFAIADLQAELKKISHILEPLPALKLATLGDYGGLHGALEYLRQKQE